MKLDFGLVSFVFTSIVASIPDLLDKPPETAERLTVSGILIIAVVYLYRRSEKQAREYKKAIEDQRLDSKDFLERHTISMVKAVAQNTESVSVMAKNLSDLTKSNDKQVEIYLRHIDKLVEDAKNNR